MPTVDRMDPRVLASPKTGWLGHSKVALVPNPSQDALVQPPAWTKGQAWGQAQPHPPRSLSLLGNPARPTQALASLSLAALPSSGDTSDLE